ncbi:MAG: hypothetical protein JKY70_18515, partial [Mucilaginibacter sp.]|nr:hypothetical protein [Mucilaginibacter sp.]
RMGVYLSPLGVGHQAVYLFRDGPGMDIVIAGHYQSGDADGLKGLLGHTQANVRAVKQG